MTHQPLLGDGFSRNPSGDELLQQRREQNAPAVLEAEQRALAHHLSLQRPAEPAQPDTVMPPEES